MQLLSLWCKRSQMLIYKHIIHIHALTRMHPHIYTLLPELMLITNRRLFCWGNKAIDAYTLQQTQFVCLFSICFTLLFY